MKRNVLRRCVVCGKYQASYLSSNPLHGKGYLCRACWSALQAPKPTEPTKEA